MRNCYLLLIFIFFAQDLSATEKDLPLVVATNTIIADIALQLVGDEAIIVSLVPIGTDPHSFDPSPSDIKLSTEAELILINGMNLENWIFNLIRKTATNVRIDTVTRGIAPIYTGKFSSQVDPHAWLDPILGKIYAKNIAQSLKRLIPRQSDIIDFNLAVLLDQLEEVHEYSLNVLSQIPEEERILITSHDAFRYFGERYNLKVLSVLSSSPNAELTVQDMIALNDLINSTGVKAIFPESTINPRLINQIARDNQLIVGSKLYTDSLSDTEKEAGNYIQMLYHNVNTIVKALSGDFSPELTGYRKSDLSDTFLSLGILLFLTACFLWMWFNVKTTYGK